MVKLSYEENLLVFVKLTRHGKMLAKWPKCSIHLDCHLGAISTQNGPNSKMTILLLLNNHFKIFQSKRLFNYHFQMVIS